MTRSQSGDLLPLEQELERTCRNFKRALKARLAAEEALSQLQLEEEEEEMAEPGNHDMIPEEQTMGSYWTARAADMRSPIQHPHVPANNFEVSTSVITMLRGSVVFRGKEGECPRSHLRRFHELIDGIKIDGVPADAIQLRYFPFTLEGQAKEWLDTRPPGSITTFANLADKFLTRYHPPSKTADLQKQITHFTQDEDETIRDAWERYSSLFLRCPNHGFNDAFKVGTFYHALFPEDKQLIDSVCGGNMLTKTPPQLNQLFEEMAENGYDWGTARRSRRAPGRGVHVVGTQSSDLVQVVSKLVSAIDRSGLIAGTGQPQAMLCQWCESTHHIVEDCQAMKESTTPQEQVNFINNVRRNDPYSNTYNEGWRQHPNFSWGGANSRPPVPQGPPGFQRPPYQPRQGQFQQPQQSLYQPMQGHAAPSQPRPFQQPGAAPAAPVQNDQMAELQELVGSLATSSANKFNNIEQFMEKASGKFLELEAGQRNTQAVLRDIQTQLGSVAQAVAQRAPGTLPGQTIPHPQNPNEHCNAIMTRSGKMTVDPPARAQEREAPASASPAAEEEVEKEVEVPAPKPQPVVKEYIPKLPFPTRLHKDRLEAEFENFMAMLRKLNVQVPFLEALSQMPKYAKFLKELLSKKQKLSELATVELSEECSAILQNKLPHKQKDPGSFTIPCSIENLHVERSLADLGASINVMPYKLFKKLGLGEPRATRMSLQLADRSVVHPRGIVEDLLVKVGKFNYPVDFVILDINEDVNVPLILGRPFLATAKALIDVHDGTLVLRDGEERITFSISNTHPASSPLHAVSHQEHESVVYPHVLPILQDPPPIPSPPLPSNPSSKEQIREEWRPKQQAAKPARKKAGDHYELVPPPPWPSEYSLACILPDGQVELANAGGHIRRVHGHQLKLYLKSEVDPLLKAPAPSPH
ncbi:unnamed protein product [Linum trigynum]|uniref:Retrotransposon gag domain-containing protein n=1 Tax=Linum trigynum TaxID=586398 RepID=A0AAV2EYI4_9ROSI